MHCNGPIVRPQTDAYSIFLEVTVGCTHSHCRFCSFYQGYPFQVASFEQIEEDLQEAAAYAPHAKHVWASGGNPFALGVEHLAKVAGLSSGSICRKRSFQPTPGSMILKKSPWRTSAG